jgi:hypothetical protein
MAPRGQLLGLAGGALAVLLTVSSCAGSASGAENPSPSTTSTAVADPVVMDTLGAPMRPEHAEVVRSVQQALEAADLEALRELYAGDDWAGQAALLADPSVRHSVLDALRTHPANMGEGYVYPGFSVFGWAGPVEVADGALLGLSPASLADPKADYDGYQTAFFLDYDPPQMADGPLRWRGIAKGESAATSVPVQTVSIG